MLITLILITVILIGILIAGIIEECNEAVEMSCVFLVAVGLFGWFIMGNWVSSTTVQTEPLTVTVLHDKEAVHLSLNKVVIASYTDVATFNYLQEKTETQIIGTYRLNMYGSSCGGTNWTLVK